jgi:RNA polymerase sigma factor (sigma-70 family)
LALENGTRMPEEQLHPILRHLQRHFPGAGSRELSDRQLLERFARHKDEDAFAALVQRHGPMVFGACRRVLRRAEDAEDAFQATFLVLARKAAAVAWRESVDRWLYQVAYRVAAEARTRNARRDALEKQAAQRLEPAAAKPEGLHEVCAVLDEALHALPARFQQPLLLCYLEGLTRDQAAGQLGWSLRTLERRLAQGRERLRQALTRQGVTLSGALLAGALTGIAADAAVSTRLVAATVRAAAAFATGKAGLGSGISATAAALADGALHGMVGVPTRIVAVMVLLLGLAAGGLGVFVALPENGIDSVLPTGTEPAQAARTDPPAVRELAEPQLDETLPPRQDRLGDPLPPGAVARMGSSRFRHLTHMASLGLVVSPDGKTLLTTNEYGIRAWSLDTGSLGAGKLLYQIRAEYHYPAFSQDGKRLAAAEKGVNYLRDSATGRSLQRIPAIGELPRKPRHFAFSADGGRLAVTLHEGEILIFDTATGRQAGSLDVQGTGKLRLVYFLAFAPDGRTLLSMGLDSDSRTAICHWDVGTQTLRQRVVPPKGGFPSPDGRLMVVSSGRGPVTIWDTQTGQMRCTLQGERSRLEYGGLAFSPEGKTLASAWADHFGARDATVSLWDTATGELRRRFRVPRDGLREQMFFSADGRRLLIPDGCLVRFWDIATGQEVLQQEAHAYGVRSLAFTPDGRSIVSGGRETIRVWDAKTGKQRQVMAAHRWSVNQLRVRPDGRTVVSCGAEGTLCVHELTSGKELRRCPPDRKLETLRELGTQFVMLGLAPDGRTAATVCSGNPSLIQVWDLESGGMLVRKPIADNPHMGAFSTDARMLACPRRLAAAESWGKMGAMPAAPLPKDGEKKKPGPGGKGAAALGPPRTRVVVHEVATGRELLTLPQPDVFGHVFAFTPDGQSLLTTTFTDAPADSEGKRPWRPEMQGPDTLRLWELATGKQRLAITRASRGRDHDFARVAVAPDGRTLATVRRDHIIQLWDLATGTELLRRPGHDEPVDCLAFSPDGKRLATGHQDSALLVWDVSTAYARRPRPRPAETRELETWWQDLAGDAPQAHRAIWSLANAPAQAVPILRDRLRPAVALPADELQRLLQDLDSPRFPRRAEASRRLAEFREDAEPTLRQALADKPSAEARQRLERILAGPRLVPAPDLLRSLRALQILEAIGDEPARRELGRLAEGAPASRLTREARAALERLAHR